MVFIAILESKDLSNFSTEELLGSLLSHETRLNMEDESMSHAFEAKLSFRGRGKDKGIGHKGRGIIPNNHHSGQAHTYQNQNQNFQPQRGRGRTSNEKSSIQCYRCKQYGNYEYECRKNKSNQHSIIAHVSHNEGETSDWMFLSCHKAEEKHKYVCFLDNGCNNHMIGKKYLISCIDSSI
jgi:hypothetical protein